MTDTPLQANLLLFTSSMPIGLWKRGAVFERCTSGKVSSNSAASSNVCTRPHADMKKKIACGPA